jgi:hypothetical protein
MPAGPAGAGDGAGAGDREPETATPAGAHQPGADTRAPSCRVEPARPDRQPTAADYPTSSLSPTSRARIRTPPPTATGSTTTSTTTGDHRTPRSRKPETAPVPEMEPETAPVPGARAAAASRFPPPRRSPRPGAAAGRCRHRRRIDQSPEPQELLVPQIIHSLHPRPRESQAGRARATRSPPKQPYTITRPMRRCQD